MQDSAGPGVEAAYSRKYTDRAHRARARQPRSGKLPMIDLFRLVPSRSCFSPNDNWSSFSYALQDWFGALK